MSLCVCGGGGGGGGDTILRSIFSIFHSISDFGASPITLNKIATQNIFKY